MHKPATPNKTVTLIGAGIALAAALLGCRQQATPPTPTVAAGIAAPTTGAAAPAARSKQQAMAALMALPELQAWSARIEQSSSGKLHGALIEYEPSPKIIDGKRYWQLSFVENGSDAAHRWESFLVAQDGDEILIDDPLTDRVLSLAQWRIDNHPMQRAAAR